VDQVVALAQGCVGQTSPRAVAATFRCLPRVMGDLAGDTGASIPVRVFASSWPGQASILLRLTVSLMARDIRSSSASEHAVVRTSLEVSAGRMV